MGTEIDSNKPREVVLCPLAGQSRALYPSDEGGLGTDLPIMEVLRSFWKYKLIIFVATLVFSIYGVVHSNGIPDVYKAESKVVVTKRYSSKGGGGGDASAAGIGGLASVFLGGALGGIDQDSDVVLTLATMRSRPFAEWLIRNYDLLPILYPNVNNRPDINVTSNLVGVCDNLVGMLNIIPDKGGVYKVEVRGNSPKVVTAMNKIFVDGINRYTQKFTIDQDMHAIELLNGHLKTVDVVQHKAALYSIISDKLRSVVLAQVQDDYVFRILDPAVLPRARIAPGRTLIVLAFTLAGFVLSSVAVLVVEFTPLVPERFKKMLPISR